MQFNEPTFDVKLQFPRRVIQIFRKRYPAPTIEESVQKAFDALTAEVAPGVHVSEKTMRELSTILACGEITSEADIISFAQARFKVGPNDVLLEVDPTLCYYIREVAENEKISFRQSVINYFHTAFAQGWFGSYQQQSWMAFTTAQWKRLQEIMGSAPRASTYLMRILEDWKVRRDAPVPLVPGVVVPAPAQLEKKVEATAAVSF